MGHESDRLILDYLSKVGDLAQTAMPARERARLVAKLREDIDRQRRAADSPTAVRKILGRLGSPDEVVAAGQVPAQRETARGSAAPAPVPAVPVPAVPAQPAPSVSERTVREPAGPEPAAPPAPGPAAAQQPVPEPVDLDTPQPAEWWRTQPSRGMTLEEIAALPGVTIPLDKPGQTDADTADTGDTGTGPGAEAGTDGEAAGSLSGEAGKLRSWRRLLRRKPAAAPQQPAPEPPEPEHVQAQPRRRRLGLGGLGGLGGPGGAFMETLAAVALIAGAVLGSWPALLVGWLLAYYSRRLSPREAKFAALGVPGTVFIGTVVWLWGRTEGRWGDPLTQAGLGAALTESFPWTVRIAAVGSALFVLWRSRRPTG